LSKNIETPFGEKTKKTELHYWRGYRIRRVNSAFLKLFLEAKKNDRLHTKPVYTKVSWLEGNSFIGLPA
jgi:hypothetical protein